MNPYILLGIAFIILIIIESIHPILPDIGIFIYFLFAYANVKNHDWLATFYMFMIVFSYYIQNLFLSYRNEDFLKFLAIILPCVFL